MCVRFHLLIYLFIYLFTYLFIYLFIYLSDVTEIASVDRPQSILEAKSKYHAHTVWIHRLQLAFTVRQANWISRSSFIISSKMLSVSSANHLKVS